MYAGLHLDTRFALLDGLLLAASFALSSIPDADPSGPLVTAFFNVMHVPLFGAVAFCSYKALAKGRELSLPDLFKVDGRYGYGGGVNGKAMIALGLAVLPVIPGFVRAATTPGGVVADPTLFDHLYTYAWFVTFALSAVIYLLLTRRDKLPLA